LQTKLKLFRDVYTKFVLTTASHFRFCLLIIIIV